MSKLKSIGESYFGVVVEMPAGTDHKYECNHSSGKVVLILDRVLNQKIPENYGFVSSTLSQDGDNLDAFILSNSPIATTAFCIFKPMALICCTDNGVEDNKVVGILQGDPVDPADFDCRLENIIDFLNTYKKGFEVIGVVKKPSVAIAEVKRARDNYYKEKSGEA